MNILKKAGLTIAGLCCSALLATTASAGVIVDVVTPAGGGVKVNDGGVHSYSHDINDQFTLGTAISGTLSINIYDDQQCVWILGCFDDVDGEMAVITVENFDFDTGGLWGSVILSAAPGWANSLQIQALAAINASGILDIQIRSLFGDFWVGDSTLTIVTSDVQAVPEPTTITMLALGLLSMVGLNRRRRAFRA